MRTGPIFQQPIQPFFSSFFFFLNYNQPLFHRGLEWAYSRQCKVDFAWFQLHLIKEAENSCSRRVREWERGGVRGGRWFWGRGCFVECFSVGSASLTMFQTSWLAKCCHTFQATSFFLRKYMFTLMCLQYLWASIVHWTMTLTTESLTCLHDLLMHVHTHKFCFSFFLYSVRLNGFLFHGGGGSLGPPFFHSGVGGWGLGLLGPLLWNPRSNTERLSSDTAWQWTGASKWLIIFTRMYHTYTDQGYTTFTKHFLKHILEQG